MSAKHQRNAYVTFKHHCLIEILTCILRNIQITNTEKEVLTDIYFCLTFSFNKS